MLRRLLLSLLIACLAIPAIVAPVSAAPATHHETMAMNATDCHHKPAPMAPSHCQKDCIGCIAPYAGVPPLHRPALNAAAPLAEYGEDQIAGIGPGPETPPPRA